jgi:class 3 adenylate cyclase/tetratricopeptide (TPR) repeat protein
MPFCTSCGEQNPDQAKFCFNCGSPLVQAAAPPPPPVVPEEERKLDTLVFVDLVGSTSMAEQLDPEDVLALLELYYGRLRTELERRGGTVEKYIGDAIVTHFGVPVAHEDDPERAVRAALAMLDAVEALNAEDRVRQIQVRIGIATGEVIVTHGQKAEEGKGIAWGDVLNTAARIESAAPVNGILVGELTYRATAHAIDYDEHEPIEAKGKSEPVPVWQVRGVKTETTARGRARDAPLVGREAELERLIGLWDTVQAERRPALALLLGDPGIGKSRLLTEVAHRAEESGEVLWGACLSYGEGITYWPVVAILEDAAGVSKSDEPATVSAKLAALLGSLEAADDDERRTMAAALANLLDAAADEHEGDAPQISQAELHWGVRRTLEHLAARKPLVLVFEDLHWGEETLFELLDYLLEADAPILLLGSARRELETIRPSLCEDGPGRIAVRLSALDADASQELLAKLLGEHGVTGARAEALLRNAGGNPLFLEETVRMLADSGVLEAGGDLDELAVPTSLQAMIGARLDGLPAEDKRAAQHASVVGMTFWSGAVADLHGDDAEVDPSLESLERRDVVHASDGTSLADEREWEFKHGLIKDVAYARVPKGRRASLHVRFVDWVKSRRGVGDEVVEIVAYHLEQACKTAGVGRSDAPPPIERAVEALMAAAEKAERREGIREADRYYARALELLGDSETEQALEAKLGRGGTLSKLGDLTQADGFLNTVVLKAPDIRRLDLQVKGLIGRSSIALKQGRGSAALSSVAKAEAIAAGVADRALQVRAMYLAAHVRWWFEDAGEAAVDDVRKGLAIAEELDEKGLRIEGHLRMGTLLSNLGRLTGAENELSRCTELLAEVINLRDEARATYLLGFVRYYLGEIEDAERLGLQALDWLERTGEIFWQLQNLRALARCARAKAALTLAEGRLRTALPLALEIGGTQVVETRRSLVDVLIEQGRLAEAEELADVTLRSLPDEDAYAQAAGLLVNASVRTAKGMRDEASQLYEDALRLLDQQQLPLDLGEARLAYGRALRRLGDLAAAELELNRARESLVRLGARGLVHDVDRELAEMSEGAGHADPLASS